MYYLKNVDSTSYIGIFCLFVDFYAYIFPLFVTITIFYFLTVELSPLSHLSLQCVSLLHGSESPRTTEAVHVPLLQADAVPGPGRHGSVQTHALERGQTRR